MTVARLLLSVALLARCLPAGSLYAQDAPQSLDDALLDGLDNELLEGAGDLKRPSAPAPAARDDATSPRPEADPASAGEQDPLGQISQAMRRVEQQLPELTKRPHTQTLQRRIVDNLTALIEQAERQQQQQSSSQSSSQQRTNERQSPSQGRQPTASQTEQESNRPAADSSDRLGNAQQVRPDPELLRGLMKDAWGHLPDRDREQMRQMAPERFVPQYELLIERYYRRLAEERTR